MKEEKRAWDFLSKDQRRAAIDEVIGYFKSEREEEIGLIAAENILDFFLQTGGSAIYNKAIDDIKIFLAKESEDTLLNLDVTLRRQVDLKRKNRPEIF